LYILMVRLNVIEVGPSLLMNPSTTRYPEEGDFSEGWYSILQLVAKNPSKNKQAIDLINRMYL